MYNIWSKNAKNSSASVFDSKSLGCKKYRGCDNTENTITEIYSAWDNDWYTHPLIGQPFLTSQSPLFPNIFLFDGSFLCLQQKSDKSSKSFPEAVKSIWRMMLKNVRRLLELDWNIQHSVLLCDTNVNKFVNTQVSLKNSDKVRWLKRYIKHTGTKGYEQTQKSFVTKATYTKKYA